MMKFVGKALENVDKKALAKKGFVILGGIGAIGKLILEVMDIDTSKPELSTCTVENDNEEVITETEVEIDDVSEEIEEEA